MSVVDVLAEKIPLFKDVVLQFRSGSNVLSGLTTSRVLLASLVVFATSRVLAFFRGLKKVNFLPGFRPLFHPVGFPGGLFPTTWWNMGMRYPWAHRATFYRQFQSEVVSLVPTISGTPSFYTNNLDVARQVIVGGHKTSYIKPEYFSKSILNWGMNLVAADGETWRTHRRIMGPAFGNKLYEYVWRESIITYNEIMSSDEWSGKKTVEVPVVQRLTFKYALFIIGKCAFGFPFSWTEPPRAVGGKATLQEALRTATNSLNLTVLTPKWAYKLPIKRLREAKEATEQVTEFMQTQIEERRRETRDGTSDRDDVFTRLVQANEDEESKFRLSDEELIGNVFVIMFAGHETTAHTLGATLGFLAYYPEIQEEVHEHILSVVGKNRDPKWEDFDKLEKVLAVFFESLRMFPSGHIMIREAREDTILKIPNKDGQEGTQTIPIDKGTLVIVDMIGVQYNPRYFEEPEKFKPSRWYGVSPESEMFTAFSIGARACLGRMFGLSESVAFLTCLLKQWKVEPLLSGGETKEQWKSRVLEAELVITLGVADMPIRFVRRE